MHRGEQVEGSRYAIRRVVGTCDLGSRFSDAEFGAWDSGLRVSVAGVV